MSPEELAAELVALADRLIADLKSSAAAEDTATADTTPITNP